MANWIKKAIKVPGALHKELSVAVHKKISTKKLTAASHKGGILAKRANLAKTLNSLHN